MKAVLTFRLPQNEFCVHQASTVAQLLNVKAATRRGDWLFRVDLDELDWEEDAIAADSAAWKHWAENMRSDFSGTFGVEIMERIEECIEIQVGTDDGGDAEHMHNYK